MLFIRCDPDRCNEHPPLRITPTVIVSLSLFFYPSAPVWGLVGIKTTWQRTSTSSFPLWSSVIGAFPAYPLVSEKKGPSCNKTEPKLLLISVTTVRSFYFHSIKSLSFPPSLLLNILSRLSHVISPKVDDNIDNQHRGWLTKKNVNKQSACTWHGKAVCLFIGDVKALGVRMWISQKLKEFHILTADCRMFGKEKAGGQNVLVQVGLCWMLQQWFYLWHSFVS